MSTLNEALNNLRHLRNSFLTKSDWTVLSDSQLSESKINEWKTYRQSLRDLTSGLDTIEKVNTKLEIENDGTYKNFPMKPSE